MLKMSLLLIKILTIICVLLSVAFITLLERKILGFIQYRKGPNKVGFGGVFQPFADAIKLFSKEVFLSNFGNKLLFMLSPLFGLFLMLMFWNLISFMKSESWGAEFGFIVMMVISSLSVYIVLVSGWASNSKYALLGAYRGVAQIISYEVGMSFFLVTLLMFSGSYKIFIVQTFQLYSLPLIFGMWIVFIMWFIVILAETNRTPFDFAESESELVSGFNIEYGGSSFALLFMAEYGNIIFMCYITSILFFGGPGVLWWKVIILIFMFLWMRGTLPRFRYDVLMMMAWKVLLPNSILIMFLVFMFKSIVW